MKNKSLSIPLAMVIKKFYCHECGERLVRIPIARTVKRGDPDYKKHSMIGHTHIYGDIELTEYGFKCPSCGKTSSYNEQCIIREIQKYIGKRTLSQAEITENTEKLKSDLQSKEKRTRIIVTGVSIALTVLVVYLWFKLGNRSFSFYF